MKFIFLVMAVLMSISVHADNGLSGLWKGTTGQMVMYINEVEQGKAACSNFEVDLKVTATEVFVNKVNTLCGANFNLDLMLTNLQNQNGKVIWEQKQIGTVSASQLHLEQVIEKKKIVIDFKASGSQMDYFYHFSDGLTILEIKGKLNKVN